MVINLSKYRFNYSFLFWFILLTLNFLFFFILDASAATQASLEWSPNSEPNLAGYRVYSREEDKSYDYTNPSWEGTETYCTIDNLDETKNYYFVARALDTNGFESGDSNEVYLESRLTPANQSPTANAGPDQTVVEDFLVTLNGSNSTDLDDGIAAYHWVQTGGPQTTLSNPNGQQTTFIAPDVGPEGTSLTFELTVVDHGELKSTDSCVVNVTGQNEPPQANAGLDQTVTEGVVVTIDGSSSLDIDDDIASYLWTQTSGPEVILSDPTYAQPTFIAPDVGPGGASLTFNLTVTDNGGLRDSDSCIVNISWQNEPPTAVVVPVYMEVIEWTLVTLDGSASRDSDDGIASYLWTQAEGDPVSLSDPTSAVITFTTPETDQFGKNLKFKLTVKDFGGLQGTAESSIYVGPNELPNNPPIADFNYATRENRVTFTDRSTDNDGTIVSWFWDFGDSKTSTEQNPMHRYRRIGIYSVTLTVVDDGGISNSTSKNISVVHYKNYTFNFRIFRHIRK